MGNYVYSVPAAAPAANNVTPPVATPAVAPAPASATNNATAPTVAPAAIATGPQRKYGWQRGHRSINDKIHRFAHRAAVQLPPKIDLREGCPPVDDQGTLGSCVGHAVTAGVDYLLLQAAKNQTADKPVDTSVRSRLFTYYNARNFDNTVPLDVGTSIHSGARAVAEMGSCHESLWPYVPSNFSTKPPANCYEDAKSAVVQEVRWLERDLGQIRAALAEGHTVACGIVVYQSFESSGSSLTGVIGVPQKGEPMLGGHAILLVGYDDARRLFVFRNSWGPTWGDKGYGYIPYNYISDPNSADEFAILFGLKTA